VECADVQRAGVAQGDRRRAGGERLVHVNEVERSAAEHVVERPRDVERRRRRRPPPRGSERQQLADAEHAHLTVGREELAGPDQPPRLAHQLWRARRREDHHAVPARGQPVRERAHEGVDLVLVLPRVGGDLRDGERLAQQRGSIGGSDLDAVRGAAERQLRAVRRRRRTSTAALKGARSGASCRQRLSRPGVASACDVGCGYRRQRRSHPDEARANDVGRAYRRQRPTAMALRTATDVAASLPARPPQCPPYASAGAPRRPAEAGRADATRRSSPPPAAPWPPSWPW
jgi:hypothetical protein